MKKNSSFALKQIEIQQNLFAGIDYVRVSKPRFSFTIDLCKMLVPDVEAKVLDVGRSYQSFMLLEYYKDVTTLGFPLGDYGYGHEYSSDALNRKFSGHIICDLNNAQYQDYIETDKKFDLIVFSEVIEHLFTAPELVLFLLKSILSENGMIICLTPNSTALHKRLKLLAGINPYEMIRFDRGNPGHFREYTKDEMMSIGKTAGLDVLEHTYSNFSQRENISLNKSTVYNLICNIFPSYMRYQVIVYRHKK